jgi:hypothetical protein
MDFVLDFKRKTSHLHATRKTSFKATAILLV